MKRVLIRMPNHLGDFIMALGLIREIQIQKLGREVHLLCNEGFALLASLVVDKKNVHLLKKGGKLAQMRALLKEKRPSFDQGILLTNSLSSAAIFSLFSIKQVVGFPRLLGPLFLNQIPRPEKKEHQVDLYKRLLVPLGVKNTGLAPKVRVSNTPPTQGDVLGIHASAVYGAAKCYPLDQYKVLIKAFLAKSKERKVVLVGVGSERQSLEVLADVNRERVVNMAGKTSLDALCSLIKTCDVFVANDSGPMHLADALGVKLIALFGSSDPGASAPYSQRASVMRVEGLSCSPCFGRECKEGHFKCMKQIPALSILERVERHLNKTKRGLTCAK